MPYGPVVGLGCVKEINFVGDNVLYAPGETDVEEVVEGFYVGGGEALEFS